MCQGSAVSLIKSWVISILGFVYHMALSKPLNFAIVVQKVHIQYVNKWVWLYFSHLYKVLFTKLGVERIWPGGHSLQISVLCHKDCNQPMSRVRIHGPLDALVHLNSQNVDIK